MLRERFTLDNHRDQEFDCTMFLTRVNRNLLRFITSEHRLAFRISRAFPFTSDRCQFASKETFQTAVYKRTLTNLFRYASKMIHLLFYARRPVFDEEGISYYDPTVFSPRVEKNASFENCNSKFRRAHN